MKGRVFLNIQPHYYLLNLAFLGQKSGKNTAKELFERKLEAIFNSELLKPPE